MHLELDYEDRIKLAQGIGLTRLRPRDSFTVRTINYGEQTLEFVSRSSDFVTVHLPDGTGAKIDLDDMVLTTPRPPSPPRRRA